MDTFDELIEVGCSFLSFWIIGLIRLANFVNTGIFQNKPLFDPTQDGDPTNDDPDSPNYDADPRPDSFLAFTNACVLTIDIATYAVITITAIVLIMYLIKPIYIITKVVGISRARNEAIAQRKAYPQKHEKAKLGLEREYLFSNRPPNALHVLTHQA